MVKKLTDADRLRAILERSRLSQRGAARQLGMAERTMRYYVAGEQPVPRAVMLAIESLTGDPAHFQRMTAKIRAEAGCRCDEFGISTYRSDEPGKQEVEAGISDGTCEACSNGTTREVAMRFLRMSAVPLIDNRGSRRK